MATWNTVLGLCTIWLSSPSPWSHWPLLTCPCSQPGPGRKQLRCTYFMLPKGELAMFQKDDVPKRKVWKLSNAMADQTINTDADPGKFQLVGIRYWPLETRVQELSIPLDERCDDRSYQWFCGVPCHRKSTATAWTLSKPASKGVELTRLSSTESRTQCNVCSFFLLCGSLDW